MKISQDQKEEIRKKLINAAVEIMTEKGFHAATMREISAKAGLGTATIYHYFPNKEKILFAYFLEKHNEIPAVLNNIPDFSEFTAKEKLQTQLETLLDSFLQDREFVQEAFKMIFDSPFSSYTELIPIKETFLKTAKKIFEDSAAKGEIRVIILSDFVYNLYWDFASLTFLYWCNDKTQGFTETSRFIDLSLDIMIEVLKSGIIGRAADMAIFLFKNHIYSNFQSIGKLFPIRDILGNIKDRAFGNFTDKGNGNGNG